jgi:hypothetical protein
VDNEALEVVVEETEVRVELEDDVE